MKDSEYTQIDWGKDNGFTQDQLGIQILWVYRE